MVKQSNETEISYQIKKSLDRRLILFAVLYGPQQSHKTSSTLAPTDLKVAFHRDVNHKSKDRNRECTYLVPSSSENLHRTKRPFLSLPTSQSTWVHVLVVSYLPSEHLGLHASTSQYMLGSTLSSMLKGHSSVPISMVRLSVISIRPSVLYKPSSLHI